MNDETEPKTRGPYEYNSYVAIPHLREWRMSPKFFISASEVGRRAHLSSSTISRLERGTLASFPTVKAIAKVFKVTPQRLLAGPSQIPGEE